MGQMCCVRSRKPDVEQPMATPIPESSEPRTVCEVDVESLDTTEQRLNISLTASPCHIRLVDCQALAEEGTLRIIEFPRFPLVSYSAITYPWRGVTVDSNFDGRTFAVQGAEHADPVGVNALRHACTASLLRDCSYLWLDRLSIIQDDETDKKWQIQYMYQVYKSCRVCFVLAGGVQRLVRLDEETTWIHRSWTLQEVLAPPQVDVLLDWKLGSGTALNEGTSMPVQEVIPNESAIAPLSAILTACSVGTLSFTPKSHDGRSESKSRLVEASIFSPHPTNHTHNDIPFWRPQRKILAPNVLALSMAMDPVLTPDPDIRAHAVWQSALMRTSSRPVDMVFSIMGLFGVTLDPSKFGKDDRRGATIALAQEILSAGKSASWLGVAFRLQPDRSLSTFPTFPKTSVSGVALVQTKNGVQEVSELVDPVYPVREALVPLPKGAMDGAGYLTFTAKAVSLELCSTMALADGTSSRRFVTAIDGSNWEVAGPESPADRVGVEVKGHVELNRPRAYAVLLGWFNRYYPGMTSASDKDNIRVMIVEEHKPEKFRLRSFVTLSQTERAYVLGWNERKFCLGGPDEDDIVLTDTLRQDYWERDQAWPRVPANMAIVTPEDEAIRKARWAVPQRALEKHHAGDVAQKAHD